MTKDFTTSTLEYNAWLSTYLALDPTGLAEKRRKMDKKKLFPLLRGSFYRWPWQFRAADVAVQDAPRVLSAGDTHLENFGTWRDAEGRLVWGVNDFDEAAELPFTSDLVRLATSFLVARGDDERTVLAGAEEGVAAILDGYRSGLAGGWPFILDEAEHETLRIVAHGLHDPAGEWSKIRKGDEKTPGDPEVLHLLLTSLPQGARPQVFLQALRGLGALGRPRWTVIAEWNGGLVAREVKATAPSAAAMPARPASRVIDHRRLAAEARRSPDPAFYVSERWVVRRLSPEARKISLDHFLPSIGESTGRAESGKPGPDTAPVRGQLALLRAMGSEVANLHAGAAHDPGVLAAWLVEQDDAWLLQAAERATERVAEDHAAFRHAPEVVEAVTPV